MNKPAQDYSKKIVVLRTYLGHDKAGRQKKSLILQAASALKLNLSQFVLDALRAKYPSLGL